MKTKTIGAIAAAFCAAVISTGANAVVSGTIGGSGPGFTIQMTYTCQGAPTCVGTYTSTAHDADCANSFTSSGAVTITGLDPSKPSSSGSVSLANFKYNAGASSHSCSLATTTATGTYTATSNGVNGAMTVHTTAPGQNTLDGSFTSGTAQPTVQIGGTFKAQLSSEVDTGTFSCSGAPLCVGIMTSTQHNVHCSNPLVYTQAISISGLTLTQPGPVTAVFTLSTDDFHQVNADGTCTYTLTPSNNTMTFNGTWDGTTGTLSFSGPDPDVASFTMTVNARFTAAGIAPPPAFPMTVTSNITPETATATATIQPRPQDTGTTQSIFVFAYVPQSLLSGKAAKDGPAPDPCVLAQLGANGQLVGASASSMTAAATTVLNASGTAVTVLNNVSTPSVAGASFYVGYGPSSSAMLSSGNYQGVVNIPGGTQCQTNLATTAAPTSPGTLTGLWWNASESGWGIHFTQRGANLFAAWYTYDAAGKPKWYVSTCTGLTGSSGTCNGAMFEVTGPNFFGGAFNPSQVSATNAGTLTLNFANANAASMTYNVAGVSRTVALTRQPLGSGTAAPAVDFTDLWWGGASESGWGMAVAQQSGIAFLAWYVYDANGKPTWLVATCTMSGNTGTGALFRTTGPAFGPSFDATHVTATQAGTVTITFTDPNNATLDYTVDGVSGRRAITRQVF